MEFWPIAHDDFIKWKHFPHYWPFVWGIHRWPAPRPMTWSFHVSLIRAWINGWVNNREAADLRCHQAHYDITAMWTIQQSLCREPAGHQWGFSSQRTSNVELWYFSWLSAWPCCLKTDKSLVIWDAMPLEWRHCKWRFIGFLTTKLTLLFLIDPNCTGGCFKNEYELLNLRALKIFMLNKSKFFQCMGKIFCVEFQRVPLKFHTKYHTHTLKRCGFYFQVKI